VKLLSPAYDADERARKRFLREARAAARLGDCRHVVTVYDIGEHDDRAYMVMEHFSGGTVAERLRRGGRIPRPLAVRWLRETAIALDCAHEHDVVHRDVKPANLLLDEHGRLAVGDFGIATVASEASVTQTGQVLGTAAYISPEQARGEPATAASDRYALAVVAFELLTGARPFSVDHPAAQARAHVQAEVPDATEVAPDLPAAVDAVLRDGLAKDPDDRPATAQELVDRLEDALGDEATAVAPPPTATTLRFDVPPAPDRRPPTTGSRRPVAAAGVRRAATDARVRRPSTPPPWPSVAEDGRRRWPAVAALAALLLAAGAVAAIALTGGGGSSAGRGASATTTSARAGTSSTSRPHTTSTHASGSATARTATNSTAGTSSTPSAASGDPRQLNDRGFALIQQGNPAAAVPLLQASVQGFRSQGRTGELDYAFALYNLATALRGTGHPADAIPLLEERLRISSYKRDVVQRELALARQQAGQPVGPGATAPAPAAKAPKAGKGDRGHGHDGEGHGGEGDGGDDGDD
jgi:serine/threonine-protein kinase